MPLEAAERFRRRYGMPYGYAVEFIMPRVLAPGIIQPMQCEWDPDVPSFAARQAHKKMLAAYTAARDDFFRDVAQMTGETGLVIDLNERGDQLRDITVFKPEAVQ